MSFRTIKTKVRCFTTYKVGIVILIFLFIYNLQGIVFSQIPKTSNSNKTQLKIFSDRFIYEKNDKQNIDLVHLIGRVKIIKENITIYSDKALYDKKKKISHIEGPVRIEITDEEQKYRKTIITGINFNYFHNEERITIEKNVRVDREKDINPKPIPGQKRERIKEALKKERTVITCDELVYWTKRAKINTENIVFKGNITVLQKEKKATGDRAEYLKRNRTIILTGNPQKLATLIQINGNWLIEEKIIDEDKSDKEQERLIKEKLTLQGEKIIIHEDTNNAEVINNVKIIQNVGTKTRESTSDKAIYVDKEQTLTLLGNVRTKRTNEDWLTSDKIVINTDKGDITVLKKDIDSIKDKQTASTSSSNQIESSLTFDENNPEQNPDDIEKINEPEPEFDLDKHTPSETNPSWFSPNKQALFVTRNEEKLVDECNLTPLYNSLKHDPKNTQLYSQIKTVLSNCDSEITNKQYIDAISKINGLNLSEFFSGGYIYVNMTPDKWTKGDKKGFIVFYSLYESKRKIEITAGSVFPINVEVKSENFKNNFILNDRKPLKVEINLKSGINFVEIKSDKSFVPKEYKINDDTRKLGVQVCVL